MQILREIEMKLTRYKYRLPHTQGARSEIGIKAEA